MPMNTNRNTFLTAPKLEKYQAVKVTNRHGIYTTYEEMARKLNAKNWLKNSIFSLEEIHGSFLALKSSPHLDYPKDIVYLIRSNKTGQEYLIDSNSIEPIKSGERLR